MIKKTTSSRWCFIKHYYMKVIKTLILLALLVPLSVALEQLVPWYMGKMVDLINNSKVEQNIWNEVIKSFTIIVIFSLMAPICEYVTMILFQYKAISPISLKIREDLFKILLKREPHFWKKHNAGDVMTKIEQVRRSLAAHSSLGEFFFNIYRPLCGIIVVLVLLAQISILFTSITLLSIIVCFILFYFAAKTSKQTANATEQKYAELFGRTIGKINHFFLIKIFGTAKQETLSLGQELDTLNQISNKYVWSRKRNETILGLCSLLFFCILMTVAVYLWVHKQITIGDVVYIFTVIGGSLLGTIQMMMNTFGNKIYQLSLLEKNLELFNEDTQIVDIENPHNIRVKPSKIEIKNLTFAYEKNNSVINNLNLTINPGEKIGIVGISGGGKTTLIHLLQRLENTPRGTIFIDGKDITKLSQTDLHQLIAFIPQDTSLFHRSIAENIAYGTFDSTQKQIKKAAQIAYLTDFIKKLPQKYDTLVGDKGIKLSGGQRQRVAIARAVLKNSPILILDEATSALDNESENYIQKAMKDLMKNKTVIAVAHRLSTLKEMDRIIVLNKGTIVEDGKIEDLLTSGGEFQHLWEIQNKG